MEIDNITVTNKLPLLKGWIRGLLIIIPFFIFAEVSQAIGYFVLGLDLKSHSETLAETTVMQGIRLTATLLLVFLFTSYIDRSNLESLGFQLKGYAKDIFPGIATGAIIMLLGFCILLASNEINVMSVDFDIYKLLMSIVLYIFVAFNEEIFFRGYILNNFTQSMNKYLALVLSSLIFSGLHLFNPNFDWLSFVSIFLAGLLLGISYIYTKNLWFPIALHFSWNFFQGAIFGFKVSGTSIYSIINQEPVGNNILNGGEFGFEGSILSQIFIVIAILQIWRQFTGKSKTGGVHFKLSHHPD
jgi:membrane protease YdiL (CAAX protease family)